MARVVLAIFFPTSTACAATVKLERMAARPLTAEELLIHRRWLHRLAVHIVHDVELANDLVQETWIAALDGTPASDTKIRPWLAGVLRNLARMNARTAFRRNGRERAWAGGDEALPSPEELLARVEAQELLVDEVQRLDEPYRSTILLLYFEGLAAADIAARLDVPDSTVRWRHRHALETLRKVLAEKDPQHRRLRTLLVPASFAGGLAVESATGFLGKGMWGGLVLVLVSVLSMLRSEAPGRAARSGDPWTQRASIMTAQAPLTDAMSPGGQAVLPRVGLELLVHVTDLDEVPIAGAAARIGALDVGSTGADGMLVVARGARRRIPREGSIAVYAPGHEAVTAVYRLEQPLHLRLADLAAIGAVTPEANTAFDADPLPFLADGAELSPATTPAPRASAGRLPDRVRCSTDQIFAADFNRIRKELSMKRMSPQFHAALLAMAGVFHQGGCQPAGTDSSGSRALNEEIGRPDERRGSADEEGGDTCATDPCDGASGTGSFAGIRCGDETPFDVASGLDCTSARERCRNEARENPGQSTYCEWNGVEIFRHEASAGSCDAFGPPPEETCEQEPEPEPEPEPDPDPDPPSCDAPCGDSGPGSYRGFRCGEDQPFIETQEIDCQAALGNCALNAALSPDQNIYCEFNGAEIFRREVESGACEGSHGPPAPICAAAPPDTCDGLHPCAAAEEKSFYRGSYCRLQDFILTEEIDCQAALGNCILNAAINPDKSFRCEWDGEEIYRREVEAGACDGFGEACPAPPY